LYRLKRNPDETEIDRCDRLLRLAAMHVFSGQAREVLFFLWNAVSVELPVSSLPKKENRFKEAAF
jgi:hypothetical protein